MIFCLSARINTCSSGRSLSLLFKLRSYHFDNVDEDDHFDEDDNDYGVHNDLQELQDVPCHFSSS